MTTKREYWIDLVRCFACLCVLTTHAPIAIQDCKDGVSVIALYNMAAVGGGSILFFMITGALIFMSPSKEFFPFIKKRIARVAVPMMFWSVIYLLFDWLYLHRINADVFIKKLIHIPLGPQVGVFWFIYAVFAIYLLAPILSHWLYVVNRTILEIYIGIFLFTLVIPYIGYYIPEFKTPLTTNGYFQYFNGFLGFALLGYYLRKYPLSIKSIQFVAIVSFVIGFVVISYAFSTLPHNLIQDRQTINAALLAVIYFTVLQHQKVSDKIALHITRFAQYTFGVYLTHFIILRHVVWPLLAPLNMNYIYGVPVTVAVTLILSLMVVYIFSKLPFHKYTVCL